jgi:hypothetical protein
VNVIIAGLIESVENPKKFACDMKLINDVQMLAEISTDILVMVVRFC